MGILPSKYNKISLFLHTCGLKHRSVYIISKFPKRFFDHRDEARTSLRPSSCNCLSFWNIFTNDTSGSFKIKTAAAHSALFRAIFLHTKSRCFYDLKLVGTRRQQTDTGILSQHLTKIIFVKGSVP